jgi:hypothetical protein
MVVWKSINVVVTTSTATDIRENNCTVLVLVRVAIRVDAYQPKPFATPS